MRCVEGSPLEIFEIQGHVCILSLADGLLYHVVCPMSVGEAPRVRLVARGRGGAYAVCIILYSSRAWCVCGVSLRPGGVPWAAQQCSIDVCLHLWAVAWLGYGWSSPFGFFRYKI